MSVLSDRTITMLCTPPTHRMRCRRERGMVADYGDTPRAAWMGLTETSGVLAASNAEVLTPTDPWVTDFKPMISPFSASSIKQAEDGSKIASYGVSSYGYDLRAAPEFKLFKGVPEGQAVDYKNITDDMFETIEGDKIVIPPHGFILTRSIERVAIPRGVLALCIGKSTIARVGINCLCTPIEPEWEGYITFEFHNTLDQPNTFYANEGVLQLIFLAGDTACLTSYGDRGGKYNHQGASIILPRV